MTNLTKLLLYTIAIILVVVAYGCADESSEGFKVITSENGFCQLEVPND